MANEKVDGRELSWRTLFPWTELFRGFQIALDLNKLFLAAAGIVVMAFGWWLLSVVFGAGYSNKPDWPGNYVTDAKVTDVAWTNFHHDREQWNIMHETAGVGPAKDYVDVQDLADSPTELDVVGAALTTATNREAKQKAIDKLEREANAADVDSKVAVGNRLAADKLKDELKLTDHELKANALDALVADKKLSQGRAAVYKARLDNLKPYATLSTMPWSEERGPNPYLLVTGQAGIPWEAGHFWDWFIKHQLLVVMEPLVKLVRPLVYFFSARAEGLPRLYFFLVFAWMVLTWSFFGGAITRIAAVQVARGEKIGLMDAINFTVKRIVSYLTAPLFPIGFILVLVLFAILFGILQLIPLFGDFVSGLLWVVPLVLGLLITVTLVGLVVGWPLMSPTISAEGTDSWEAVSRSFSYVFQKPFHYLWYSIVAVAYGAILIFFVGFMGSFAVEMSKWAVSQTPFMQAANREPSYLMVYAPTSFGWRDLLLQGAKVDGKNVVHSGKVDEELLKDYKKGGKDENWHWWNTAGAGLMAIWLGLIFLLVIGFGYSFFWTSITIIYMLMRKAADGAELDEVYLEEDDTDGVFGGSMPSPAAPAAPAPKATQPLTMVEPPTLRPSPVHIAPVTATMPVLPPEPTPTPAASVPPPPSSGSTESTPPPN